MSALRDSHIETIEVPRLTPWATVLSPLRGYRAGNFFTASQDDGLSETFARTGLDLS